MKPSSAAEPPLHKTPVGNIQSKHSLSSCNYPSPLHLTFFSASLFPNQKTVFPNIFPLCSPGTSCEAALSGFLPSANQTIQLRPCCQKACWVWKGCRDSQHHIYFRCFTAARGTSKGTSSYRDTLSSGRGGPLNTAALAG